MKIGLTVVCLLAVSFGFAYAEQIPESIKDNAKMLYSQNNFDEKSVESIIVHLSNQKIIKNIPDSREIYKIPAIGQIDFIEISGRIQEFGRTAQIVLEITKPNGVVEKHTTPLLETGRYNTVYPIDWNSQIGTYKVTAFFVDETKSISFFHLTKTKLLENNFPAWLVIAFEWWLEEKISDAELVYSIEHLAKLGLVHIPANQSNSLEVEITGEKFVRRGITHTINVQVTDGYKPIEGARVTLTIEDYGENIIREFEGLTNQRGFFVFSWEIPKSFDDIETLLAYISVSGNGFSETKLWKFQVYCLPGTNNCQADGN